MSINCNMAQCNIQLAGAFFFLLFLNPDSGQIRHNKQWMKHCGDYVETIEMISLMNHTLFFSGLAKYEITISAEIMTHITVTVLTKIITIRFSLHVFQAWCGQCWLMVLMTHHSELLSCVSQCIKSLRRLYSFVSGNIWPAPHWEGSGRERCLTCCKWQQK